MTRATEALVRVKHVTLTSIIAIILHKTMVAIRITIRYILMNKIRVMAIMTALVGLAVMMEMMMTTHFRVVCYVSAIHLVPLLSIAHFTWI